MNPVLSDLEATQGDRYRCPLCDARRGLSIDPDEGQTGVWHCFSCQEGGTGAELYAAVHNVTITDALNVYGVSGSDLSKAVRKREEAKPPPEVPEYSDAEWAERCRVWKAMNKHELRLRDQYRHRRAAAQVRKDHDAFERWQRKLGNLFSHVLQREIQEHHDIDELDAHTSHLKDHE